RVQGRKTKHAKIRVFEEGRFKCSRQKSISNNKISKR
ncbi:MAG: TIGR03643 family protein, partial [Polaribacter sp.]|nr:TIGR03643 family protein [Polaribacter sp.]